MRYEVRATRRAEADIDAAMAWLVPLAPLAANRWRSRLLKQIASLEDHPERCPLADESADLGIELRELLFGRRRGVFRILYVVEAEVVTVLRIRRAAQDRLGPDDV